MAGLYWDITLLASVGKETATKTISRQAILYSSSGLMFSAQRDKSFYTSGMPSNTGSMLNKPQRLRKKRDLIRCITGEGSHHFFVKKEPRQELGRSRRVILLLTTAHKHSWPPGNTKNMHEATGCALTMTSFKDGFRSFNVTFMSVSLGM